MARSPEERAVRVANCSGFYGDVLSAARQQVEGGPVDVLTGDYLAELTMLILFKAKLKSGAGYARTFLAQLEEVLGTCLDKGIRVVANAGGLSPGDLAAEIEKLGGRLGLHPRVAYVEGDDLMPRYEELRAAGEEFIHLDTGRPISDRKDNPVTANAYLGGWGIAEALGAGADIVVTGRVTDAALVTGPAAWWHGWGRTDWDRLAGAVVAGHVIECGPQATGGNYAFFQEITDRRYPGFPIAEVAADGSSVITKHPGTGGLVSPGTVTAQLLYEIGGPAYEGPDVVTHFDTITLSPDGENRVLISGTKGSPPSGRVKVAANLVGGYRNSMTLVLTGLDIEAKAQWAREMMFDLIGGEERFAEVDVQLLRFDHQDADVNAEATAHLRVTVKGDDERVVGRAFSNAAVGMALACYPGLHPTTPPTSASAYGVYWPALVSRDAVEQSVVLPSGERRIIEHSPDGPSNEIQARPAREAAAPDGPTRRVPLGLVAGARSGDKGGNANVGLWAKTDEAFAWLRDTLDVDTFVKLLPEARDLTVHRYELPNLRALNFVVVGLLGEGVASATRPDPQAKGLGEYVRSRYVDVPVELLRAAPQTP